MKEIKDFKIQSFVGLLTNLNIALNDAGGIPLSIENLCEMSAIYNSLERELKGIHGISVCPTCLQEVDKKLLKAKIHELNVAMDHIVKIINENPIMLKEKERLEKESEILQRGRRDDETAKD